VDIIVWVVVMAVAVIGEVLTTSFFLVFFALGASAALLVALLGGGWALQILSFILVSVLSMFVLRPALVQRLSFRTSERYESRDALVGRSATVTAAIEPGGSGTVRVGSGEFWTARALHGDPVEEGSRVRIMDRDGLTVLVEPVEE
jgi:membrane protein implicated in regulation of membrane protease activity